MRSQALPGTGWQTCGERDGGGRHDRRPELEPVRDFSARNDIEALKRTLPVVNDIKDYMVPGIFETDEKHADFRRMLEADRQADLS